MQILRKFCMITAGFVLAASLSFADTIYMKNGNEIKGIVVEDYKDRVVISTYEGEKTVFKKDISEILYDLLEQNLISLGDTFVCRQEFGKAYFYYEKAAKANSESRVARERMNYVMGRIFRARKQGKLEHIKRMEEYDKWPFLDSVVNEDFERNLEDEIGISVALERGKMRVVNVMAKSPAYDAGIKKNDIIISIWSQLTGYMSEEELARSLIEEHVGEIKAEIERAVVLKKTGKTATPYRDIISGKLNMLTDGLTIVDINEKGVGAAAGLEKGDLIVAINDMPTRYMPLKEAICIIESKDNADLIFEIRRNVTIWRK